MTKFRHALRHLLLTLALLPLCALAAEPKITALTAIDRQYLQEQRDSIGSITGRNFGMQFSGATGHDIALLQRVLDERLVGNSQRRQLQAMGVILGDLLAAELDMHWVVYEDNLGRSHALRYRDSETVIFPVTMISRRRETGNTEPVADIYRRAESAARETIPRRPFTAP